MGWTKGFIVLVLSFALSALSFPAVSASPPFENRILSGTVYSLDTGLPIENACVFLAQIEDDEFDWKRCHIVYHTVVRADGKTVVIHVVIHYRYADGTEAELENYKTCTDAGGRFAFDGLDDGRYVLVITKPDYTSYVSSFWLERDLHVSAYLASTLAPVWSVEGKVYNSETNEAVSLAEVRLEGIDSEASYAALSDALGNYRFENVVQGSYWLKVTHDNFYGFELKFTLDSNKIVNVPLVPVPTYTLSGSVFSASSGLPLGAASIEVERVVDGVVEASWRLSADSDGAWSQEMSAKGVYRIRVSAEGHSSYRAEVVLTSDLFLSVYLVDTALPTYRLEGKVYDDRGAVEGATVMLSPAENFLSVQIAVTDSSGNYAFENVRAGRYLMSVSTAWHRPHVQALTLDANKTVNAVLARIPTYWVSGSVRDTEGLPVAEATVSICAEEGIRTTLTGSDGSFSFSHYVEGEMCLTISKPGYVEWTEFSVLQSDLSIEAVLSSATGKVDVQVVNLVTQAPIEADIVLRCGGTAVKSARSSSVSWDVGKGAEYVLWVGGEELSTYESAPFVLTSAGRHFVVYLRTAYDVSGTVVWRDELGVVPLQGRQVKLVRHGPDPWSGTALTGAGGTWEIEDVVPGTYDFVYENLAYVLEVDASESIRTVVRSAGASVVCPSLSGSITLDGEPYDNFVTLRLYDGVSFTQVAQHAYSFADVPVGSYILDAVWTDAEGVDRVWRGTVEANHEPSTFDIALQTAPGAGLFDQLPPVVLMLAPFLLIFIGFVVAAMAMRRAFGRRR